MPTKAQLKAFVPKKRTLIRWVFILPLITCVLTGMGIKSFVDTQRENYPTILEENIEHRILAHLDFLTVDISTEEHKSKGIYNLTKAIDVQRGVAAELYEFTDKNTVKPVYNFTKNDDKNTLPLDFFQRNLDLEQIRRNSTYVISNQSLAKQEQGVSKLFYLTLDEYLLVWTVKPDFVSAYLIDFEELFTIIVFALLINMIASFSSLVFYYCLENRVDKILKRYK